MSGRNGHEGAPRTPAERIEAVRRMTPPPEGRRSRLGYISKEDFVKLVGASRSRIFAWTAGKGQPEEPFRKRLAELSQGRFTPDDFLDPDRAATAARRAEQRLEPRVAALEESVARVEKAVRDLQRREPGEAQGQ